MKHKPLSKRQALRIRRSINASMIVRRMTAFVLGTKIRGRRIRMSEQQVDAACCLLAKYLPPLANRPRLRTARRA